MELCESWDMISRSQIFRFLLWQRDLNSSSHIHLEMLVRTALRYTKSPGTLPLPFLYLGGCKRRQPPVFAICQVDGQCYGDGEGVVGARIVKQNTLACEYMRELYRCENQLEAEMLGVLFGLKMAQKSEEEAVGLETVSIALMKALFFAEQPLPDGVHRMQKAKILDLVAQMDWVGLRWIPDVANAAKRVPAELAKARGDHWD
jgi:ribonuclease HI